MTTQLKTLLAVQELAQRLEAIERALDAQGSRMVSSAEAAEMLGISVPALHKRVARGAINCAKDESGHLRFRISDINR